MTRTFFLLLLGNVISQIGTIATGFALGVWIYSRTASVTLYTLSVLCSTIPGIVMVPLAGILADRWDRRALLLLGQGGGGVVALGMVLAERLDELTPVRALVMLFAKAAFETLMVPVFTASVSTLVSADKLDRANGLVQSGAGLTMIVAPLLGGLLLPALGLGGVLIADLATFLLALLAIASARLPSVAVNVPSRTTPRALLRDGLVGLHYLQGARALLSLLALALAINFCMGMVYILFSPLVLVFSSPRVLGIVRAIGGLGFVVGSVALSFLGGSRRRIEVVLALIALKGAILLIAVIRPSVVLAGVGSFSVMAVFPFVVGSVQTLWQQCVPIHLQGRIFALRTMAANMMFVLAFSIAGPLSDGLFEPWMAEGGALSGVLGPLVGVGKGRGIALLLASLGVLLLATAALARSHRPLRALAERSDPTSAKSISSDAPVDPAA